MKKVLLLAFLSLSLLGQAQRGSEQKKQDDFTPEQHAVLKTKKMAHHLDLSQKQQDELLKVNRSWAEKRAEQKEKFKSQQETPEKSDPDARYQRQLQRLDAQISYQNQVKNILNEEQYALWKEHRSHNMRRGERGKRHSHSRQRQQGKG